MSVTTKKFNSSSPTTLSLEQWLKKHRTEECPKHHPVRNSLVKNSAYCPKCDKYWKLIRSEYSWRYFWYYCTIQFVDGKERLIFSEKGGRGK